MAYKKQNFKDGDILTAQNLNLMEDGIVASQEDINLLKDETDNKFVPNIPTIDKADWVEDADGIPDDWIDREVSFKIDVAAAKAAGYAGILSGFDTSKTLTKSKGNGFAYDTDSVSAYRAYVERSGGRGVYNKFFVTSSAVPVLDPDGKDWAWSAYVKDENGNDTKKPANGAIPLYPKNSMDSMVMRHNEGDIVVPHTPKWSNSAASKQYVDTKSQIQIITWEAED